jgi:accessory colonization factor AcfC
METMKSEIAEDKSSSADIRHFISLIRKCKNPTEISDSMFNELVDKIVVYEAEGAGNVRTQKVDIYFNYVGQVDIAKVAAEDAGQKVRCNLAEYLEKGIVK